MDRDRENNRKTKKQEIAEIYDGLCKKFDSRDKFYRLLEEQFKKYGHIPYQYLADWNTYQRDPRPWRDVPGVKRKLKKTAKIMQKNNKKA